MLTGKKELIRKKIIDEIIFEYYMSLQARLLSQGFTDQKLLDFLWKKGSILKKNQHYALVKQVKYVTS